MSSFYVYIPPLDEYEKTFEDFQLIKDGKSKLGLVFPFLFLIWHRLWIHLIMYVVLTCAILCLLFVYPSPALSYLSLLLNFFFYLEGNQLRANKLEQQGWRLADIVNGENKEEAALRFLSDYKDDTSHHYEEINSSSHHQKPKPVFKPSPAAGLFPE